jgi:hypothetical protein
MNGTGIRVPFLFSTVSRSLRASDSARDNRSAPELRPSGRPSGACPGAGRCRPGGRCLSAGSRDPPETAGAPLSCGHDQTADSRRRRSRSAPPLAPGRRLLARPSQAHTRLVEYHAASATEKLRTTPLRKVSRLDVILPARRMGEDVANAAAAAPDPPLDPASNIHRETPMSNVTGGQCPLRCLPVPHPSCARA